MAKLLLLSIILATIAVPARAARDPDPRKGLRKALINLMWANFAYVLALRFIWHRL